MSNRTRRHLTPQKEAEMVRRQSAGKEAVSALAEEFRVQPSRIHGWVHQVLAQAEAAFQRTAGAGRGDRKKDEKALGLEAKLAQKNEDGSRYVVKSLGTTRWVPGRW
jgi:transposase-like protein